MLNTLKPFLRLTTLVVLFVLCIPASLWGQGGSNYIWYDQVEVPNPKPEGPYWYVEDYGVLFNYHEPEAQSVIDGQLQGMYNAGQRRLRIPIFHSREAGTGAAGEPYSRTVLCSAGNMLSETHEENLRRFLTKVREIGFVQLMIGFFPHGKNDPTRWNEFFRTYNFQDPRLQERYQENWNLIVNLRPIFQASGIPYHIDLMNEALPPRPQDAGGNYQNYAQWGLMTDYCSRLWTDYTLTFGKNDTVGFSINTHPTDLIQSRILNFANIYGPCPGAQCNGPYVISAHIYDGEGADTEFYKFWNLDYALFFNGYPATGIIIGEANYNDQAAAEYFRAAVNAFGRTIFHVLQWPQYRYQQITDPLPLPTTQFSEYLDEGF